MSLKDKLLFGEIPASIDARGRITLVKGFREVIPPKDDLFILEVPSKKSPYEKPVLLVYPESFYEKELSKFLRLPLTNSDRALFFSAIRQEIVSNNRIQLPTPFLRKYYYNYTNRSIPTNLCGNGNCFYIVPLIDPSQQPTKS
jgi:DNA-binding transcriptional regulator/RsmH inhibitor MraZ